MRVEERTKFQFYLALELSPTLVLVLTCLTVTPLVCPPTRANITRPISCLSALLKSHNTPPYKFVPTISHFRLS